MSRPSVFRLQFDDHPNVRKTPETPLWHGKGRGRNSPTDERNRAPGRRVVRLENEDIRVEQETENRRMEGEYSSWEH